MRTTATWKLRHVPTGETAEGSYTHEISDAEVNNQGYMSDYKWLEGNWGCDCNRRLDFERALGRWDETQDSPCGHGEYVYEFVDVDGVRIVENNKATESAT